MVQIQIHLKDKPRRGLGLHFVPYNVKFNKDAYRSKLWKSYIVKGNGNGNGNGDVNDVDPSTIELNEKYFPISKSRLSVFAYFMCFY